MTLLIIGFVLCILLSAFSTIDPQIFEMAEIDGASGWKKAVERAKEWVEKENNSLIDAYCRISVAEYNSFEYPDIFEITDKTGIEIEKVIKRNNDKNTIFERDLLLKIKDRMFDCKICTSFRRQIFVRKLLRISQKILH